MANNVQLANVDLVALVVNQAQILVNVTQRFAGGASDVTIEHIAGNTNRLVDLVNVYLAAVKQAQEDAVKAVDPAPVEVIEAVAENVSQA